MIRSLSSVWKNLPPQGDLIGITSDELDAWSPEHPSIGQCLDDALRKGHTRGGTFFGRPFIVLDVPPKLDG